MRFVIMLVVLFFVIGCDINPSKFGHDEAMSFAENLTYVKDKRTGLCFAIVASRRTGDAEQSGMGITQVPCDIVRHYVE